MESIPENDAAIFVALFIRDCGPLPKSAHQSWALPRSHRPSRKQERSHPCLVLCSPLTTLTHRKHTPSHREHTPFGCTARSPTSATPIHNAIILSRCERMHKQPTSRLKQKARERSATALENEQTPLNHRRSERSIALFLSPPRPLHRSPPRRPSSRARSLPRTFATDSNRRSLAPSYGSSHLQSSSNGKSGGLNSVHWTSMKADSRSPSSGRHQPSVSSSGREWETPTPKTVTVTKCDWEGRFQNITYRTLLTIYITS